MESDSTQHAEGPEFAVGVRAWLDRLGLVRDAVRQELVWRQLATHLPSPVGMEPVRVLDVGCGQGTQLVRLARAGYQVTGVDPSSELLSMAAQAVQAEPPEVVERATLQEGDLDGLEPAGDGFDVVCCHGVVMYLVSLADSLCKLVSAARPGGLVSVLSKNQANLALRAAMLGDWQGALDAFDARFYTNRLGIERARADRPQEMMAELADSGAEVVAWYGVRLFTDHWRDVPTPDDFEVILRAEQTAGERDLYRQLCSATHVLARRPS